MKYIIRKLSFICYIFLLIANVNSQNEIWTHSINEDIPKELAQWAIENNHVQEQTGLKGQYELMNVRNILMYTKNGMHYKFTTEMLVNGSEVFFGDLHVVWNWKTKFFCPMDNYCPQTL